MGHRALLILQDGRQNGKIFGLSFLEALGMDDLVLNIDKLDQVHAIGEVGNIVALAF